MTPPTSVLYASFRFVRQEVPLRLELCTFSFERHVVVRSERCFVIARVYNTVVCVCVCVSERENVLDVIF